MEHPTTLGEHLKRVRITQKVTQQEVARILGVNRTNIWSWESGRLEPSARFVPKIICFLGYDPRPEPTTFGEHLARIRQDQGLSQRQLADLLGVDPVTVRRWEAGQAKPSPADKEKLKRMFPIEGRCNGIAPTSESNTSADVEQARNSGARPATERPLTLDGLTH